MNPGHSGSPPASPGEPLDAPVHRDGAGGSQGHAPSDAGTGSPPEHLAEPGRADDLGANGLTAPPSPVAGQLPGAPAIFPTAPQPGASAPRDDTVAPAPSAPRAERTPSLPHWALGPLASDRVAFTGAAASLASVGPAAGRAPAAAVSPDVRHSDPTPAGASVGAAVGGSAGSSAASPIDLRAALVLLAVGGWSLLVLVHESYRSNLFLALPERPG